MYGRVAPPSMGAAISYQYRLIAEVKSEVLV